MDHLRSRMCKAQKKRHQYAYKAKLQRMKEQELQGFQKTYSRRNLVFKQVHLFS